MTSTFRFYCQLYQNQRCT